MSALFIRELKSAWRASGAALTGVLFFLAVIAIFPFAIGPDTKLLAMLAPSILWIGVLLASLLELDRLFAHDREDGSLDILIMQPHPMFLVVFIKAFTHWVVLGLPLLIATPFFRHYVKSIAAYDWCYCIDFIGRHARNFIHWNCGSSRCGKATEKRNVNLCIDIATYYSGVNFWDGSNKRRSE